MLSRRSLLQVLSASIVAIAASVQAQESFTYPGYEAAPIVRASDILKPEYLSGPNHRVLDRVTTYIGRNRYGIETNWGIWSADGDAMLMARVAEANAMAELERVSGTAEFESALKEAAKTPYNAAKGVINDPKGAIKGSAKGMWKFMNRAGESIKGATESRPRAQGEDNAAKSMLGFSKAKREVAIGLGVDPYSSNEAFQEKLGSIAWTRTAGAGAFKIATMPIGGGAGIALTATEVGKNMYDSLRDLSPSDLRLRSKKMLIDMGVSAKEADAFLANPAFSPTSQTSLVSALASMNGVKNRGAFAKLAKDIVTEEGDAQFCAGTAQLLAAIHSGADKLARITTLGDFPVAIAADGRLVIALQWDTAFWSAGVEEFIDRAQASELGKGGVVVAITGRATERTKAELAKRKIGILTNALAGPQK